MPKIPMIEGVNDSKVSQKKERKNYMRLIIEEAISYSVGIVDQMKLIELIF